MEHLENMTTDQKNGVIADSLLIAFYCYGMNRLGYDIDYVMNTNKIKETGLSREQVENLTFNIGPNLALCLG